MITVAINKQCNLACPTCDSGSSSFWYRENLRNNIPQSKNIINLHRNDKEKYITNQFLTFFKQEDLSQLRYIKFGGGEPLINDTHLQILDLIPYPENVTVHYTSNFSIFPSDKIFKTWEKFKLIKWVASLDGVDSQFEYLRWPYDWNKLQRFVSDAVQEVPTNVMFGVEHTLNPLNIYYFDKFENWFNENFKTNKQGDLTDLNLHCAEGILGLSKSNEKLKNLLKDKYGKDHKINKILFSLDTELDSGPMLKYLDDINQWRNLNWKTIFPEVWNCYK